MSTAIYPGSFDPITNGHIDIIERVASIYDHLTVLVSHSPAKGYLFSSEERVQLAGAALSHLESVTVDSYEGLTVSYAKEKNVRILVRGLRAVTDFEQEMALANMNRKLNSNIETLMIFSSPESHCISSRLVKEVAKYGGDLSQMVPENVALALKEKLCKN